jgi:hypothetical protein
MVQGEIFARGGARGSASQAQARAPKKRDARPREAPPGDEAMPDPSLSMSTALDDDLPRTVRRERDAREREAREREAREREVRDRETRDRDARDRAMRERDARETPDRTQRERERERERDHAAASPAFGPATGPALSGSMAHGHASMHGPQPMRADHDDADLPAPPATVTAFDVPFINLMFFFLKAVIAGIPALLLIGAIMWGVGHVLQTFFPALLKLKIMIYVPQL